MTKLRTVHRRAQLLGGTARGDCITFNNSPDRAESFAGYLGRIGCKPVGDTEDSIGRSFTLQVIGGQTVDTQTVVSAPGAVEGNSCVS